jgi:hypothetical protein
MSVFSKQSSSRGVGRLWKTPTSSSRWLWLLMSILLYAALVGWYIYATKTQPFVAPANDPFRLFGIIAYVLILATVSYTLRRRFMRQLPGMVQDWLWMHTWLGVITILVVFLHENFAYITHDYCQSFGLGCLTDTYWAVGALYALLLLVVVGIAGRLLDAWLSRVIAREASLNKTGIESSVRTRLRNYEYTVERYCAGKSDHFKQACSAALSSQGHRIRLPEALAAHEQADWQKAEGVLYEYGRLTRSLQRQQRAQSAIRIWRTIHICLAVLAMVVISYHGIMELLTNVFHIIAVTN